MSLELLINHISDPIVRENFQKIEEFLKDLSLSIGTVGPRGPRGSTGPQGVEGDDGKTILNGESDPASEIGVDGDFYLNTVTCDIFGPKSDGLWGDGVSIMGLKGDKGDKGDTGAQGERGFQGIQGEQGPKGDSLGSYFPGGW